MSESKQYLYKIYPVRIGMLTAAPTPREERILKEHYDYLRQLTEQGVLILAGRTLIEDEKSFGLVIFYADSEDLARNIMATDPAVKEGVMRAELFPYRVALMKQISEKE
ncbi:MAG: hypothetical protein IMY76_04010 [Chloroflexi bacterium]|nr:hypothetical protein [Chloroflexota bacterium]